MQIAETITVGDLLSALTFVGAALTLVISHVQNITRINSRIVGVESALKETKEEIRLLAKVVTETARQDAEIRALDKRIALLERKP